MTPFAPPVLWKTSSRTRHISLRIDAPRRAVVLSLPPRVSRRHGLAFLQDHAQWVSQALATLPPRALESGYIPVEGQDIPLLWHDTSQHSAWQDDCGIHLSNHPSALPPERQLLTFLRALALKHLPPALQARSTTMALAPSRVSLRNATSRWGSCTRQGRLMLNWRLIMAPTPIRDYVMVHELAHLRHFNHSPTFWALVDTFCPNGRSGRTEAELWLRENGTRLLCIV